MAVPEILWSAQRQYRHNRGDDELICGFDQAETEKVVNVLLARIDKLEAQVSSGLEYTRQTCTRARLMDQKTPMMLKLLSRIERLLEILEPEGGEDE